MSWWRRWLGCKVAPAAVRAPSVGADRRVYAIGDVHGRADLLDTLLGMIAQDDASRGAAQLTLIFLGDLMDRGDASRAVIERVMALIGSGGDVRCLQGNHEELFIAAARGDIKVMPTFRRMGGEQTLESYGLGPGRFPVMSDAEIAEWMLHHVPRGHVDFLDALPDWTDVGDYLFVHAGIRPGVAIEAQKSSDLRWIRRDFLNHDVPHSHMVVHGHSITPEVDEQHNRIGIDTGAYRSGRLTALGLQGTARWTLQTVA
ncbi:metallophosphoesterase [Sphingobium sp. ba1]|uniref:metallophosphoesterase n=1 Tax=Sphingobium sp. ba1 TaxID=1522072 RepID=UPI0005676E50|nr:metallophosphoesterase [Sphingobium sp. ba1]